MKKSFWKILSDGTELYAIAFIMLPLIGMLYNTFKSKFDVGYFIAAMFFFCLQLAILIGVYRDYIKQK